MDIFKEAEESVMPTWAKFKEAGDKVQGTYVGKIVGQVDGYGNKQVIYQLLQEDGKSIVNVGFGLNKKFIIQDMDLVRFGQIVGFEFKGKVKVKDRMGKEVEVKDFGLRQKSTIVNEVWLKEHENDMPKAVYIDEEPTEERTEEEEPKEEEKGKDGEDVPFSSEGSLTEDDKLKVIEKLAKDKLGVEDLESTKTKVMEELKIAFIPINYQQIIEGLTALK